ncbi:mif domain containing protein [Ophiostoma piceae UAMH 11346]|uniref:L-dopachrome isomerase n=1 Tax=Ophiostoma piceae (strain UAMH 11346) TaxID=1262450 RepID=S3CTF1_OPHP1|nr:mif domain containing protein [Ophiostoma piceae UAMH 11346]
MDPDLSIDTAQQHGKRPLPSINSAGKPARSASKPSSDEKKERRRDGAIGTVRGPREMTSTRCESGHERSSFNGNTDASLNVITDPTITVGGQDTATPLSFSQRAAQLDRSPTPLLVHDDQRLLRDIDRAPPGDLPILRPRRKSLLSLTGGRRDSNGTSGSVNANGISNSANKRNSRILSESIAAVAAGEYSELARRRSQYFEDIFSARDGDNSPVQERIRSESLVLAEIRTNVHVGDEFTIITELSAHLASRYSRPLSSIVVAIQHGQCMCFGGSFDSAYVMSVTALPSQLQPTTNKRNAALIQKHMEEALGVPAARGHLRFVPVPETNLAYGGNTTVGHLDELARSGSIIGAGPGAAAGASYNLLNAQSSNDGVYVSSPAKASAGGSPGVQDQAISSGLGSRKYKTARKLSVKSISSSFRSPSQSPEKTTAAAPPPDQAQGRVSRVMYESATQKQANVATTPAAAAPAASTLPIIPEMTFKEGQQTEKGTDAEGGNDRDEESEKAQAQTLCQDKFGGRIGIHELLTRGSAPQASCAISTANIPSAEHASSQAAVGRKPSRRARRTKSFVATFFGRSASASATTTPKTHE